jgi:hypothetical protein
MSIQEDTYTNHLLYSFFSGSGGISPARGRGAVLSCYLEISPLESKALEEEKTVAGHSNSCSRPGIFLPNTDISEEKGRSLP